MKRFQKTCTPVFIALLALSSYAAEDALFEPAFDGETLYIQPTEAFASFTLRVQGPDHQTLDYMFDGGETPFLSHLDQNGEPLADGRYKYELVATPFVDEAMHKAMAQDRSEGRVATENHNLAAFHGVFTVINGRILDPYVAEDVLHQKDEIGGNTGTSIAEDADTGRDQVILDDLIVDGSACIGFDCVNGESFGFDTLRLKENNLRIKFEDTSTGGSFPSNDWIIEANSSANGGSSHLAFVDVTNSRTPFLVEAFAPSNSLYVDDGGRVGIRTSTPSVDLHIVDGDSPALRLEQNGTSGFGPQTWDIAGNETNFFVRDVSNGSTLPFRIFPNSPGNRINISPDGIGINDTSPSAALDVAGGDVAIQAGDLNVAQGAGTFDSSSSVVGEFGVSVTNTNTTSGGRSLLNLTNKGTTTLTFNNTNLGNRWNLSQAGDGFVIVSSSGGSRLKLKDAGGLSYSSSAGSAIMSIDDSGNMIISGSLTQNGVPVPKRSEVTAMREEMAAQRAMIETQAAELAELKAQLKAILAEK